MASKASRNSTLVLRILALLFLAASVVVMATDKVKRGDFHLSFKDVKTYRYVIATAIIGFIYTLIQIPFAIYYVCAEKRLIRNECLPEYDFYADKVISFLLATGVGAGFAVTYEAKDSLDDIFALLQEFQGLFQVLVTKRDLRNFLNQAYVATGLLFLGFFCMAILSVISSASRASTSRRGGFFG